MQKIKKEFDKISQEIKNVKIQGAKNIAEAALKAYFLIPSEKSKNKLLSLRSTEPLLRNVLDKAEKSSKKEIMNHFKTSQEKINKIILKIIKNSDVIFTHCHSSTVVEALTYAKRKGKKFEVYATETRPLFQGRKTVRDLKKAKIKTTLIVDSAAGVVLSGEQGTKKPDKVFLGADALLKSGIINKIGSETICKLAEDNKVPVYILADSWKFSKTKPKMEQRAGKEVWKAKKIEIKNPAFEFVPKKYIKAIVSELGILKYNEFLKKCKN